MNTELRERLEEAAVERVNNDKMLTYEEGTGVLIGFMWGAEYGYKEAIEHAKGWLKEQGKDWWEGYGLPFSIADFEADMNKLWEGEFDLFIHL